MHADRQHVVDRLALDLRQRLEPRPDRIVDQHGDRGGKFALDPRKQRVDVITFTDVDPIGARVEALALQLGDRGLQPTRADVDTRNPAALFAETLGNREADAPRRAGDDAHAILETRVHALALRGVSAKALAISRSWNFCTFPAGVFGRSATISTRSGQYCLATLCSAIRACTSARSSVCPGRSTTNAQARSPNLGSGYPTIAVESTAGCLNSRFSISKTGTFSPPRMMMSLMRPSMRM